MSSAPVTPAKPATTPTEPGIVTRVENDLAWMKLHFIAILVFLGLLTAGVLGAVSLIEHLEEAHDVRIAAVQLKAENVDTSAQQALVAELAKEHADDQVRDAQQSALIQSLISQMQQQHAATAKQVATDSTLDAQAAASRLVSQTRVSPSEAMVNGDNVTMDLPMTRTVVADLDNFTQAQSDVTNLQDQLAAQQTLTTDAKTELGTSNGIIATDKTELIQTIKADNAACVASTKVAVDEERNKGNKRTFWGTVIGIITGYAIHK